MIEYSELRNHGGKTFGFIPKNEQEKNDDAILHKYESGRPITRQAQRFLLNYDAQMNSPHQQQVPIQKSNNFGGYYTQENDQHRILKSSKKVNIKEMTITHEIKPTLVDPISKTNRIPLPDEYTFYDCFPIDGQLSLSDHGFETKKVIWTEPIFFASSSTTTSFGESLDVPIFENKILRYNMDLKNSQCVTFLQYPHNFVSGETCRLSLFGIHLTCKVKFVDPKNRDQELPWDDIEDETRILFIEVHHDPLLINSPFEWDCEEEGESNKGECVVMFWLPKNPRDIISFVSRRISSKIIRYDQGKYAVIDVDQQTNYDTESISRKYNFIFRQETEFWTCRIPTLTCSEDLSPQCLDRNLQRAMNPFVLTQETVIIFDNTYEIKIPPGEYVPHNFLECFTPLLEHGIRVELWGEDRISISSLRLFRVTIENSELRNWMGFCSETLSGKSIYISDFPMIFPTMNYTNREIKDARFYLPLQRYIVRSVENRYGKYFLHISPMNIATYLSSCIKPNENTGHRLSIDSENDGSLASSEMLFPFHLNSLPDENFLSLFKFEQTADGNFLATLPSTLVNEKLYYVGMKYIPAHNMYTTTVRDNDGKLSEINKPYHFMLQSSPKDLNFRPVYYPSSQKIPSNTTTKLNGIPFPSKKGRAIELDIFDRNGNLQSLQSFSGFITFRLRYRSPDNE